MGPCDRKRIAHGASSRTAARRAFPASCSRSSPLRRLARNANACGRGRQSVWAPRILQRRHQLFETVGQKKLFLPGTGRGTSRSRRRRLVEGLAGPRSATNCSRQLLSTLPPNGREIGRMTTGNFRELYPTLPGTGRGPAGGWWRGWYDPDQGRMATGNFRELYPPITVAVTADWRRRPTRGSAAPSRGRRPHRP
jgi:hypothetical protein